jgi:hypothetical protein
VKGLECKTGAVARKNFETTMTKLFRAPKMTSPELQLISSLSATLILAVHFLPESSGSRVRQRSRTCFLSIPTDPKDLIGKQLSQVVHHLPP